MSRDRRGEVSYQAPKTVAIGGGTGLSTLLRGLKRHTPHITAIVTVADDGGSSGRLRRELGVLPPGDFRNCIAALADDEALITQLFQYRFGEGQSLNGHCFGNLFITALAAVTGSFERAILEAGRVLAVQGRILPSTLEDVTLIADLENTADGSPLPHSLMRVQGESAIPKAGQPIERVFLRPDRVRAYPGAVRAILEADLDPGRSGQPFHKRGSQPARPGHPPGRGGLHGPQDSMCATWPPSLGKPMGSTWASMHGPCSAMPG